MTDMYLDVFATVRRYGNIDATTTQAFRMTTCSWCGPVQAGVIAYTTGQRVYWLRCSNCGRGIVEVLGHVSPETRPLAVPLGLPEDVRAAWEEVRGCLSVGAYTAAVTMARKILLHIAVDAGLPAKNDKGWGPSFAMAVAHLESSELITKRMLPWVERIKDIGNDGVHEIPAISEEDATDVARFTLQLLQLAYEMDAVMGERTRDSEVADDGNQAMVGYIVSQGRTFDTWIS